MNDIREAFIIFQTRPHPQARSGRVWRQSGTSPARLDAPGGRPGDGQRQRPLLQGQHQDGRRGEADQDRGPRGGLQRGRGLALRGGDTRIRGRGNILHN